MKTTFLLIMYMALTVFSFAPAHTFSQAAIFLSTIHLFFGVNKNQFHGKSYVYGNTDQETHLKKIHFVVKFFMF